LVVAEPGPSALHTFSLSQYLYAEAGIAGAVDEFQIKPDGSLSPLGSVAGLGAGLEGIAAS
jgi:hypothetical protein